MEISLSVDNLFDKEYYECYKTRVGPFLRNLRCDNNMRALYMNRIVFCLTWLILVVSAFWAQSRALGASNAHVDCMGREAEVSLPVKKVVALNSDVLEVLRSLKAQDLVVGVFSEIVREREFWGDMAQRPKLGRWLESDM